MPDGSKFYEGCKLTLWTVEKFQVLIVHVALIGHTVVGMSRQPGKFIAGTKLKATVVCLAPVLQLIDLWVAGIDASNLLNDVVYEVVESSGLPGEVMPTPLVVNVEVDGILCV